MLKGIAVLKKLTCVAALLGYFMPHHGFSNIFSEKLSLERTVDEEGNEQNLYLSALKTGFISSSILSLFGQRNRKNILASGLIPSGLVLTRDFLEQKADLFLGIFPMNFLPHKSYCLYELTVGLVSGLFVNRLFKNKKWGTVFGTLGGLSFGMIEALFGDKIGLYRIVCSINRMSSSFTEKIDELYKKIDNIVRHVAKEVQNDIANNESKTVEWYREEFSKKNYPKISCDPFLSFCVDKLCEFEDCCFSDDYETEDEINAKIKKALDLIRTRICIQTGKDLQNIKDLENAAFKKIREEIAKHTLNISTQDIIKSLLPTYDWSEEDWNSGNKNLERLLFIRVAKAFAETLHREEPILSVIKTVGTLCANAINFVIPALAVSLLPEKIRGTAKNLFVTTFLTIMADGLTDKTVNSLIKPAGLLGLVSFASGWKTKTIYGLLKNKLISK